jgi:hypothetical protein
VVIKKQPNQLYSVVGIVAGQGTTRKRVRRICGNGEEEREGCCIKGATASDYIHEVKYLEHSRSAVSRDAVTTR